MFRPVICKGCRKIIEGPALTVSGASYHPGCFLCSYCKKPIQGAYHRTWTGFLHPACYQAKKGEICTHCGKALGEKWLVFEGKRYHEACFSGNAPVCAACKKTVLGNYIKEKGVFYHDACYKTMHLPQCGICKNPVTGKYVMDPWGNTACASHNAGICESCSRIISESTSYGGRKLKDGRMRCGICAVTAIESEDKIPLMIEHVAAILNSVGITGFEYKAPLELVLLNSLEREAGRKIKKHVKGFTKTRIESVAGKTTSVTHRIFILTGLPRLEFGAVLAHELLHVWLAENNIHLSDAHVEGFCNLGSMLVLINDASEYARVLLDIMHKNPDPLYGAGYRKMKSMLSDHGWDSLLQKIRGGKKFLPFHILG